MRICSRLAKHFSRNENGGATVEFVLWVPVFVFVLCLVADASLIFGGQAQVLRIVQDSNRAVSIGRFRTTDEAKAYIESRIGQITPNAEVTVTIASGIVRTVVDMPASDLTATSLSILDTIDVAVVSEQLLEA
jgi:Flp pilus assembly protein TadG